MTPPPGSGRWPRRLLRAVVVAGLGLSVALPAGAGASAAVASSSPAVTTIFTAEGTAGPLPVTVELTSVGPAALTPGGQLTVTGRLLNTSTSVIAGVRLGLRMQTARLTARQDVQEWSQDVAPARTGVELPGASEIAGLAPGVATPFTMQVPADQLGLARTAKAVGPRGLAVEVTTGADTLVGLHRTTFVWLPRQEFTPTSVSLLMPLTGGARENAVAVTPEAVAELKPDGRLGRLMSAGADPAVAWAVDPAVLETARRAARGAGLQDGTGAAAATPSGEVSPSASPSATSSPPSGDSGAGTPVAGVAEGRAFLDRVETGLAGRTAYGLPFADPDVVAVARRDGGAEVGRANAVGVATARSVLGRDLDTTLAWPGDGLVDDETLRMLVAGGRTTAVLDSAAMPTEEDLGHTVTGRASIDVDGTTVTGLLYDRELSEQFGRTGAGSGVDGTQQLISELAALTLERPSDGRHVLLAAPRDWDPEPAAVQAAVAALHTVPWVTVETVPDLVRTPLPEESRSGPAYPAPAEAAELGPEVVGRVLGLDRRVSKAAEAFTGDAGAAYVSQLRLRALSLLSLAWRGDSGIRDAVGPFQREVLEIDSGVVIAQGSTVNLLASEAEVPVVVDNRLEHPLDVVVSLRPRSGQIAVPNSVRVTLPAGANRQRVLVPVEAVASGNVELEATVRTVSGDLIGSTTVLDVRVRRGWEARGLGGAAAVLLLLLALGLVRGARSGRPNIPAEAVPDVDDLATERARRRQVYPDVDTQQIPRLDVADSTREHREVP